MVQGCVDPYSLKLGKDTGRSSLLTKFVSEFIYLAAFSNAGVSKSSDVENQAKFRTFAPWKNREGVYEICGSINEAFFYEPREYI